MTMFLAFISLVLDTYVALFQALEKQSDEPERHLTTLILEGGLTTSGYSHHDGQTSSHHLGLFISDHQDQVPDYMNMSDSLTP